jgi:choline dehydrogenase-like flavoprotein
MTDSTLIRGERPGLTGWEQALRAAGAILIVISLVFAVEYVWWGTNGTSEFPFTTNSVAKDLLLAGLGALLVADVRRWALIAVGMIVLAHLLMPSIMGVTAMFSDVSSLNHTWQGTPDNADMLRIVWSGGDLLIVLAFVALHHMAVRSRYDLKYLTPSGFRALMAVAEVLVLQEDREITPAEVAKRVDVYLAGFRAHEKWKIKLGLIALAFWPLLTLRPPLAVMSVDGRRRFIQRRFIDDIAARAIPEPLRVLRQTLIRLPQQFVFFGYYGDPRAAGKVDYVPFSQLPDFERKTAHVVRPYRPVQCLDPVTLTGDHMTADVVIVGTGAGGATLAYQLARRGREVLMLERGAHIDPEQFTENEAEQLSLLYADGALTLSKDFRLRVGRGMCVGGSTTVNNAVCLVPSEQLFTRWLDPDGLNAGLDARRLAAAFEQVKRFLCVGEVGPPASLNPGAWPILDGLNGSGEWQFKLFQANIRGCLGCGYCNIGCKYGKKLSALDWTLPRAQQEFPGAVRILADCRVDKVLMRGSRATGVAARMADGRRLTISANTVVLSAGTMASSVILQRSGLGEGRAGQGISFNLGSPVTLDFAHKLHSERGLQMSHYVQPTSGDPDDDGVMLETWFNPVVAQSLFMPGWFDEHWANMRRYAHMTCLGVVIGTESNGSVKAPRFGDGLNLDYVPTPRDFVRLKEGVKLASRIGLKAGAERVLPSTFRMIDIRAERELSRIDEELGDDSDLSVNSSHPQGGNPMSLDATRGVVDPSFRVYGTTNVHVCDASVFPSSVTVNPQLTVMALAAYAADEIGGPAPTRPAPTEQRAPTAAGHVARSGPIG